MEDTAKLAVLAVLAIADKLFQAREDRAQGEVETVERVTGFLRLLDEVAPPSKLFP